MDKIIKGYYKDGVWHEYGGKLYDSIGYNTDGSITQKAISDSLGGVIELINGYKLAIRVHGDADCSNLHPFYFVNDGDSFTLTISYEKAGLALKINSIIMGEEDITTTAYDDGVITIDRVTDNVIINVETASVTDTSMFTKRTTGNGISILNDKALLKGVRGNSLVLRTNIIGDRTEYTNIGLTISRTNKVYHISGTCNTTTSFVLLPRFTSNSTHKYFCYFSGTHNFERLYFGNSGNLPTTLQPIITTYNSSTTASVSIGVKKNVTYDVTFTFWMINLTNMFGEGNEPSTVAEFRKLFPLDDYDYTSGIVLNNSMTNYISKDENEEILQNVSLNVPTLTGKLNGEGESVVVFPNGMKSSCNEAVNDTYDEIKQVDGVWKAIKRIGTERATSAISGRGEYEILAQEEVYVLDDQTIPTEITVVDQGTEEILPTNGTTPTTAPTIMEIQYGSIPQNNLLGGGLLGGMLGGMLGGSNNGGGSDDEEQEEEEPDYEEEVSEEKPEESEN